MEKHGGLWFGWSGSVVAGAAGREVRLARQGDVQYATLDLSREEHERYYNGFSNGVLWPLLHTMPELMHYDRRDAEAYREVNGRFAAGLQPLLRADDVIWVHDYHLLPLAAALRARGVRNPIGFFLHIPFCAPDVLTAAPEVAELVRDLLAADLIGFQTDTDLANFVAAAQTLAGALRGPMNALFHAGRRVRLGVFPVEIAAQDFARTAQEMVALPQVRRLQRSLEGQKLILGVERLDPTKGLLQRLDGLRRLLEKRPEWCGSATAVQIAAMSRKGVGSYQALRTALDRAGGALNADFGTPDWQPLRLVVHGVERSVVAGYLRLARVGLVTPLRDGMNLVAKEFVAAQDADDPGVLVLSRFAGAARQLEAALLVNPRDPDAVADALDTALRMSLEERRARWRALWAAIEHRSPLLWGRSFVAALLRGTVLRTPHLPMGGMPAPSLERPRLPARLSLERAGSEREPPSLAQLGKPGRVLN
jgi:trehalose 6-phosphate synthase